MEDKIREKTEVLPKDVAEAIEEIAKKCKQDPSMHKLVNILNQYYFKRKDPPK